MIGTIQYLYELLLRRVAPLRWCASTVVNACTGPRGFAATAGLWFNDPIHVAHRRGRAYVRGVNERIVETPFVCSALLALPAGSSIIDVGGNESSLGLALASSGYRVSVVDPRGYSLVHPNLQSISTRLEDMPHPPQPADAIVFLSTVEHFGVGAYGQDKAGGRPDLEAIRAARRLVRPGGLLVLTVPLGQPRVDDFQRVYSAEQVGEMCDGWQIERLEAAWQTAPTVWQVGEATRPAGERGVAMVVARNPGPART